MDIPIIDISGINEEGVITPEQTLMQYEKLPKHIDTAVIFFDNAPDQELIKDSTILFRFVAASSVLPQYIYKDKIVLAYSPLGGPCAGGLIEELVYFGIKKVIACGSSGLIGDMDPSNFLLVSKAIRDEGLSYHYLEPSTYVDTDINLNNDIKDYFIRNNLDFEEGIAWTTDAFFRETKTRIKNRLAQGAVAVEMECASMAAVSKFRKIQFSQVLYFSDIVNQKEWSGFREDRRTIKDTVNSIIIDFALSIVK